MRTFKNLYCNNYSLIKIFFSNIFILAFFFGNSQVNKGTWLVGGNGKFYAYKSHYTSPNNSYTTFNYLQIDVSPNVSYFIVNNLALGIRPTISSIKGNSSSGGITTNIQRYLIGPFCRYYFIQSESPYNLLVDINYQHGFFGGNTRGRLSTFSILAGAEIYMNNSIGIEFLLGYNSNAEDSKDSQKISNKGYQVGIGFQIHLEK